MSYEPPRCMAVVEAEDRTETVCPDDDDRIVVVLCEDRSELVELEIRIERVEKDVYSP